MVINPIVGVYIPIIRIPIKGGMTISNIVTFDHGTYDILYICNGFLLQVLPGFSAFDLTGDACPTRGPLFPRVNMFPLQMGVEPNIGGFFPPKWMVNISCFQTL